MSYRDMFGYTPASDTTAAEEPPAVNPLDDTGAPAATGDDVRPLAFQGFASPLPLLLERPSRYLRRLEQSASSMFRPPENGGDVTDRILYSPAVALPFFVLQGDELFANETVLQYPLLHVPSNHPLDESTDPSVYALTLIALYTASGLIYEDGGGNLFAYGLPVGESFTVDDKDWRAAADWAESVVEPLGELNKARLLGFTLRDRERELPSLSLLFDLWGETRDPNEIIRSGKQAAQFMEAEYGVFIDTPFTPFSES